MMTTKQGQLATLADGRRFIYGGVEWVVLERCSGTTTVLAADVVEEHAFDKLNKNNFASSYLREYLNGEIFKRLIAQGASKDAFAPMALDLTSNDGLKDYGTCQVRIGLITCDMYRRFRSVIPRINDCWWTCTPNTIFNPVGVCYVHIKGFLHDAHASCGTLGLRPCCMLQSDILVSYDDASAPASERLRPTGPTNAPLTLEELRNMSGELIFYYCPHTGCGSWRTIETIRKSNSVQFKTFADDLLDEYGQTWLAYRRKPDIAPLTLEELRNINGEQVWIADNVHNSFTGYYLNDINGKGLIGKQITYYVAAIQSGSIAVYRHQPKEDRLKYQPERGTCHVQGMIVAQDSHTLPREFNGKENPK